LITTNKFFVDMTFLLKIGFLSDWWQMSSGLVNTI